MVTPTTYMELCHLMVQFFPNATIALDNDGQVIIYTDLAIDPTTTLGNETLVNLSK